MGKLALAAKITHVPSMYLSELPGPRQGTRQDAIDGHIEIGRRCRELGVDTIVVFDTHWLVNANYHINCGAHFKGLYTSNEMPHFISNMAFEFPGNPAEQHPPNASPVVQPLDVVLESAVQGGYAGAWPWSFSGTDGYGRLPSAPLRTFAARHPDLVNPRAVGTS